MKLQHLRLALSDDVFPSSPSPSSSSSSVSMNSKRFRPLAPKLSWTVDSDIMNSQELRLPETPKADKCIEIQSQDSSPPGSTRWNPMAEQIRVLEGLYRGGMRTPTAQQIESITAELGKHGKIQGKNVFYWFQNHKARERQRVRRGAAALLALDNAPQPILPLFTSTISPSQLQVEKEEGRWLNAGSRKHKCRSWEDGGGDGTLELFPLHPGRDERKAI